ncbi:MAG: TIGR03750 family conjugal transfer protein [Actinomycetaceae bacterium]|nr:TIGR03750 family conjugal transfer protein [Actinomycetaceae bacterium]
MNRTENTSEHAQAAQRLHAPLTDRVNAEPAILHGMSVTEAKVIFLVSFAVFSVIAVVVMVFTHIWQLLLGIGLFGPLLTLWYGSQYLEVIKRGYPDAYYTQAIRRWFAERGLAEAHFMLYSGQWSLGRPLVGLDLSTPLMPVPDKPRSNKKQESNEVNLERQEMEHQIQAAGAYV